jgi:asparagine synthase (glutamine-hydrolysing)
MLFDCIIFPNPITKKKSKQAYHAPITSSFFNSGTPAYVEELLSDDKLRSFGLFNPAKIKLLINKIKNNQNILEVV